MIDVFCCPPGHGQKRTNMGFPRDFANKPVRAKFRERTLERWPSWSSSPNLLPQQPQHGMAQFKGGTRTKLTATEAAASFARNFSFTFPRCCSVVVRPTLKLRGVGAGSTSAPQAKNSTSPVAFPAEDTHGKLRLVRYCWRRPCGPAGPLSVPPTIHKARRRNDRVHGRNVCERVKATSVPGSDCVEP